MIYINKFENLSEFEVDKNRLDNLEHYLVYCVENNKCYLKKHESYVIINTLFETSILERTADGEYINVELSEGENKISGLPYGFMITSNISSPYTMAIQSIDASNYDSSQITNMSKMFNCEPIESINLTNFKTHNVTNMSQMFESCSNLLTSLDLSSFDTSNVNDMSSMFSYCISLTSLDLSNFDTSNVTNMGRMFYYCNKLTHIKCKQSFQTWCWTNQDTIYLPTAMRDGGSGTWEIVG